MANKKITQLAATSAAVLTDLFEKVNDPSGTPTSEKVSLTQIVALIGNQAGAGSPIGVKTPVYVGQLYNDTGVGLWQATGLTNADWFQLI